MKVQSNLKRRSNFKCYQRWFFYVLLMTIVLPCVSLFALPWPDDFNQKVADRIAEVNAGATSYTADAEDYDTASEISTSLADIGSVQVPFDTRIMTWEFGAISVLNTKKPGFTFVLR